MLSAHYPPRDRLGVTCLVILPQTVRGYPGRGQPRMSGRHPRTVNIVTITFHLRDERDTFLIMSHWEEIITQIFPGAHTITDAPSSDREYWKLRGCIKILCSFTAPWLTSCKVSQICNMSADSRRLENIRSSSQKLSYKLYAKNTMLFSGKHFTYSFRNSMKNVEQRFRNYQGCQEYPRSRWLSQTHQPEAGPQGQGAQEVRGVQQGRP